jgi:hypothetical protein
MRLLALCIALLVLPSSVSSHEAPSGWSYPIQCCSNRDCTKIDASEVRATAQGYEVTLKPGMHDFITEKTGARSYVIPYSRARQSPDGEFHICIRMDLQLLCFFAPPPGA